MGFELVFVMKQLPAMKYKFYDFDFCLLIS